MKKMIAIVLALMLCVTAMSVAAFAAEGDTVTVHAVVPEDWTAPNVYSWATGSSNPNWPGEAMTAEGDEWVGAIPATDDNVIINNNGSQTVDLSIEAGKEVWIVIGDVVDGKYTATVSTTAPGENAGTTDGNENAGTTDGNENAGTTDGNENAGTTGGNENAGTTGGNENAGTTGGNETTGSETTGTLSNFYVTGGKDDTFENDSDASWLSNWTEKNVDGQMVQVSEGVYEKTFKNVPAGSYALKVNDGTWNKSWGDENGNNYYFSVSQTCDVTVTFTVNGETGTVSVKGTGVPQTADFTMISVVVLLALAATTTVILVSNKKKFI